MRILAEPPQPARRRGQTVFSIRSRALTAGTRSGCIMMKILIEAAAEVGMKANSARLNAWQALFWTLGSTLAWAAGSELLRPLTISSMSEIAQVSLSFLLPGLLTGMLLGAAGGLFLRRVLERPLLWVLVTALAFPAFFVLSFLLEVSLLLRSAGAIGVSLASEGGSGFIMPATLRFAAFSGLLLSLIQLPTMRRTLWRSASSVILWVFGSMAALVFGVLAAALIVPHDQIILLRSGAVTGLVSGALIAGFLLIIQRRSAELEPAGAAPS